MTKEVTIREWIRIRPWCAVYKGDDGQFWYVIQVPEHFTPKGRSLSLPCQELCGHELKRVHLTCLTCRFRKAWRGDLPMAVPIEVYMITWVKGRRFESVKKAILKRLLSLAEFFAN